MNCFISLITIIAVVVHNVLGCHGHFVCGADHLASRCSTHVHQHADDHQHHDHLPSVNETDTHEENSPTGDEHSDQHATHSHLILSLIKSLTPSSNLVAVLPTLASESIVAEVITASQRAAVWHPPPSDLPRYLAFLALRN
nr:hypothetical protein [Pirellula staleyi]